MATVGVKVLIIFFHHTEFCWLSISVGTLWR